MTALAMYDSIDVTQIPADAYAVAGYVGGNWPTYPSLVKRFPAAHRLSIAVFASQDAECLDIEKGDATPQEAPGWVQRQLNRGVKLPVLYTSVSAADGLLALLKANGISRSEVRLWTAHYTYKEHFCSSACGFGFTGIADATQWDDKALGRNLDISVVSPGFFLTRKPASVLLAETGYWAWLAWTLGEQDWKGWGAFNLTVRPNVPQDIDPQWWTDRATFLAARPPATG